MNEEKKSYSKPILFSIQKCRNCGGEIFLAKVQTKKGDKWGPLDLKPLTKDECVAGSWYVTVEGSWTSKFIRNSVYFQPHKCEQGEIAKVLTAPEKKGANGLGDDFDTDDLPF